MEEPTHGKATVGPTGNRGCRHGRSYIALEGVQLSLEFVITSQDLQPLKLQPLCWYSTMRKVFLPKIESFCSVGRYSATPRKASINVVILARKDRRALDAENK